MRERVVVFAIGLGLTACGPKSDRNGPSSTGPDAFGTGGSNDADCPAVHFTAAPTTPSIELLIDQSGSMISAFGNTTRYDAVRDALVAVGTGIVGELQSKAYFG